MNDPEELATGVTPVEFPNQMEFEFSVTGGNLQQIEERIFHVILGMFKEPVPHNVILREKRMQPEHKIMTDDGIILVVLWECNVRGVVRW